MANLLAPVAGRTFDLVVANPPFVAGPGRADYAYRDSGLAGDAVTERLVRDGRLCGIVDWGSACAGSGSCSRWRGGRRPA